MSGTPTRPAHVDPHAQEDASDEFAPQTPLNPQIFSRQLTFHAPQADPELDQRESQLLADDVERKSRASSSAPTTPQTFAHDGAHASGHDQYDGEDDEDEQAQLAAAEAALRQEEQRRKAHAHAHASASAASTPASAVAAPAAATPAASASAVPDGIRRLIHQTNAQGVAVRAADASDAAPAAASSTTAVQQAQPGSGSSASTSSTTSGSAAPAGDTPAKGGMWSALCCCLVPQPGARSAAHQHAAGQQAGSGQQTAGQAQQAQQQAPGQQRGSSSGRSPASMGQPGQGFNLLGEPSALNAGRKCLVLDLDETLVHSSFHHVPYSDYTIPVAIDGHVHNVFVLKRPGVDDFMLRMGRVYEVVIYTASLDKYADPLLDLLDIHKVISKRLFRESCCYYEGHYVKDLSRLNRPLSDTIIVDNSPVSFLFQPENAIDCSSFIDDLSERELDDIARFLEFVATTDDVRDHCRNWRRWCAENPAPRS